MMKESLYEPIYACQYNYLVKTAVHSHEFSRGLVVSAADVGEDRVKDNIVT